MEGNGQRTKLCWLEAIIECQSKLMLGLLYIYPRLSYVYVVFFPFPHWRWL